MRLSDLPDGKPVSSKMNPLVLKYMARRVLSYVMPVLLGGFLFNGALPISHKAIPAKLPKPPHVALYSDTARITVTGGWNLISLPLSVPDGRTTVLFPGATSYAFSYQKRYVQVDTLQYGTGYWLKFASPGTVATVGTVDDSESVMVKPGWNIIGTLHEKSLAAHIATDPPGIIVSKYYRFNGMGGYNIADTIEPGKGYWVKANQNGRLSFGLGGRVRLENQTEYSGIEVKICVDSFCLSDSLLVITDSGGYFSFDDLTDGNYQLLLKYPFFKIIWVDVTVQGGIFTVPIDTVLEQRYQFWSEPAETTISKNNLGNSTFFSLAGLRAYWVNITDFTDTIRIEPKGDGAFEWQGAGGDSLCSWYKRLGCTVCDGVTSPSVFPPGDTSAEVFAWHDFARSCFLTGDYLFYWCLGAYGDYPKYLNPSYFDQGSLYQRMNLSLFRKVELFRPSIVHIIE